MSEPTRKTPEEILADLELLDEERAKLQAQYDEQRGMFNKFKVMRREDKSYVQSKHCFVLVLPGHPEDIEAAKAYVATCERLGIKKQLREDLAAMIDEIENPPPPPPIDPDPPV